MRFRCSVSDLFDVSDVYHIFAPVFGHLSDHSAESQLIVKFARGGV